MNELQRQRYLTAMGIDSFVPRLILPWAPPSVPCQLPQAPVAAAQVPAAPASVAAADVAAARKPTAGPEAVGQVLRDMGISKPTAMRKEPLKAALPKQREALTPIHLHLWRPADDLIVIDHYQPGAALPTDKLLHNILRLLCSSEVRVDAGEVIRCPINDKVANLYTRQDMQIDLQAWFSEELQKTPAAQVWLLGAEAATFLLSTNPTGDAKAQQQNPNLDSLPSHFKRYPLAAGLATTATTDALILPSLTEMLNAPELKDKLWHAVRGND